MARSAAAAPARAPRHRPGPRRATPPRRRSGPVKAPVPRTLRSRLAGVADSLLHGRGWIALVAVLLVGIVFFNVDLLQMNREITRTAERSSAVKRENALLKLRVARLASTERIQRTARDRGLVLPAPGKTRSPRANRAADARRAAKRIVAPGDGPAPAAPAPAAPAQPAPVQQRPTTTAPQAPVAQP